VKKIPHPAAPIEMVPRAQFTEALKQLGETQRSLQGMINIIIVLVRRVQDLEGDGNTEQVRVQIHELLAIDGFDLVTKQDPETGEIELRIQEPREGQPDGAPVPAPAPAPKSDIVVVGPDALRMLRGGKPQ